VFAIAVVVASTLGWMGLEALVSTSEPHEHLPRELATGIALFVVHATAIVEHLARGLTTPPALFLIGATLVAGGIALRVTSIRALGSAFVSTTTAPVRFVRAGPYRVMRHPSEIGLLAAAVGAAALLASVVAAAVIAFALLPLIIVRCVAEDRTISRWAR
jgi:protein-S-isoprenylcysteine O-methyltransferase